MKRRLKSLQNKLDQIGDSILIPTRHQTIEKARKLVNEMADLEFRYQPLIEIQSIFQKIFWEAKTESDVDKGKVE